MILEDNPTVIYMVLVSCCTVCIFGYIGAGFHIGSNYTVNHTNYLACKL